MRARIAVVSVNYKSVSIGNRGVMTVSTLAKKLKIKPGDRIAFVNAPEGYLIALGELPDDVEAVTELKGKFHLVHLFVKDSSQLEKMFPRSLGALNKEGVLWVSYPKKSSKILTDLTRDQGWEVTSKLGQRPVSMISVDDTWSAVRFRKAEGTVGEDAVEAQYAGGKAALKPVYQRLVRMARGFGSDVDLAPRKSYVGLTRGKMFAVIKPSTRTRLDLGLKLKGKVASGRLQAAPGFGSGSITHKVALTSLEEVDDELLEWMKEAYEDAG
jgi:hypothetical protein